MANLLEQIGQGLRSGLRVAGAGLSPRVYESQEREREQFEQIKARRDEMLMEATLRAVESGALAPEKAQRIAQAKGWQLPPLGPGIQAQKFGIEMEDRAAAQQKRSAYEQELQEYETTAKYTPPPEIAQSPEALEVWGKRQLVDDYMRRAEIATKYQQEDDAKRWRELAQTEIQAQRLKAETPLKGQTVDLGDRVVVIDPTKIGQVLNKGLSPKDAAKGPETLNQKEITEIESKLRDDFWQQVGKEFTGSRDAHDRIQAAAQSPSAAGDLALIYNYMRLLDPTSVVRESEFAVAAQTGAYGERIKSLVNKALTGERLTDVIRNDFVSRAEALYERAEKNYQNSSNRFKEIAKRSGANPDNVLPPITPSGIKPPAETQSGAYSDPEKERRYQEWKRKQEMRQ